MTLDGLDAAFLHRLAIHPRRGDRPAAAGRSRRAMPVSRPNPSAAACVARNDLSPAASALAGSGAGARPERHVANPVSPEPGSADPLVARLLARAPEQWDALAGHVEAARQRGRRVVAIAGGRSGEGRTTLVRCLAETLRNRGRDVACAGPHDLAAVASGPDGRGPTHDKRIILVDAGIWFPPGPIRRPLLQVASLGCEAAILVRRSGATGGLARRSALEAIGIEVLGEVLTFAAPGPDDIHDGDHPA